METGQNKYTWLDSGQNSQVTLMEKALHVPQGLQRLFTWQLILFSEHLLQGEEQKYG